MMTYSTIKKISLSAVLTLGFVSSVYAAEPSTIAVPASTVTVPAPQQPANPQSTSIEFARQAGSIAGVAQACGQNITDFNQRIAEAVDKLTTNSTDKAASMLIYQQVTQAAMTSEKNTQTIPCTKALSDYRNLPIMQPDYKEKIIAQLNPTS